MILHDINHRQKKYRSNHILRYANQIKKPVVVFSCGNAYRALDYANATGQSILPIGDFEEALYKPSRWLTSLEIVTHFPNHFDATSGHLPMWMMGDIAEDLVDGLRESFRGVHEPVKIPSGSGETVVCLSMAFPHIDFIAQYDNTSTDTTYMREAPLNRVVVAVCKNVQHITEEGETKWL